MQATKLPASVNTSTEFILIQAVCASLITAQQWYLLVGLAAYYITIRQYTKHREKKYATHSQPPADG